jgi:mRNA interferase RelE/StbE
MFEIILSDKAAKFYNSSEEKLANKINSVFKRISENPYQDSNIKKLKGKLDGLYRYKFGNHRIVYAIEKEIKIVSILWIGKRKDAY